MPLYRVGVPQYSLRICHYRGIIVLFRHTHHRRDRSKEFSLRFEAKYNAEGGKDWSEE